MEKLATQSVRKIHRIPGVSYMKKFKGMVNFVMAQKCIAL